MKQNQYGCFYRFIFACTLLAIGNMAYAKQINQGVIKFERSSSSSTLSGAVIRGDRDVYSLYAGADQWMEVKISALENNAVFSLLIDVEGTESQALKGGTESTDWYGQLPKSATSKNGKKNVIDIIVGGTRGNASYNLSVTIKNKDWKKTNSSFFCKKAVTQAEKLICKQKELREADKKMSRAYHNLRKVLSRAEQKILKADQRRWLKARNVEFKDCKAPYCHVFYLSRIAQLNPVSKVGFNCKKAQTSVENKICNSPLLRHADGRMSVTYKDLINFDGGGHFTPQEQRNWLKIRNKALAKSNCNTACAFNVYNQHTDELVRRLLHGSL
jgi:uncharacterized protein